jgi:hypothetical protein
VTQTVDILRILPVAAILLGSGGVASAADARSIVEEVYRSTLSRPLRYEGLVQVFSAGGAMVEKRWLLERQGEPGYGKVLIRFLSPPEVKGVALLILSQPRKDAEQWMYTPAIARVRRIAPQSRGSRFYATDLTFGDLEEGDPSSATYKLEGEETCGGDPCWRIAVYPAKRRYYDRSTHWISQSKKVILRTDHVLGGGVVKRILAQEYRQQQGVWTPARIEVLDLGRGGRTILSLQNVRYDVRLPGSRFTPEALRGEGL